MNLKKLGFYIILFAGGIVAGLIVNKSSDESKHAIEHGHESMAEIWTCSMHPQVRRDAPGKCPLCSMDLIPVSVEPEGPGLGVDEIQLTEAAMNIASIQTVKAKKAKPQKQINLSGKIAPDERNIAKVTAHFNGRVEHLFADFTGQRITKGQKLATLYSPDLVTAQKELFEALKFKKTNPSYYTAAVQKLKLWELTDGQIEEIINQGEPQYSFNVYAPRSGTILTRQVTDGEHVKEGKVLFEIADLKHLWVLFDAYESDLSWIKVGDSVTFNIQSLPGKEFTSIISFINPVLNNQTRTTSIRAEIINPNYTLKPEMFVDGSIEVRASDSTEFILVPKSAILWTGKRAVVYVKQSGHNQPTFQFRNVRLGPDLGEFYAIEEGISEGEEVVANGVFKIDAAAQLQGKTSMMGTSENEGLKMNVAHENHEASPTQNLKEPHPEISEVSSKFKDQIKDIYQNYLPLKDALIQSDAETARKKALPLSEAINRVDDRLLQGDIRMSWRDEHQLLLSSVDMILKESALEDIRDALSPLSDQLYNILIKYDVPTGGFRQFCPMAFDFKGGFWLSDSDEVLNPYFGDEMLTCGSVEEELK